MRKGVVASDGFCFDGQELARVGESATWTEYHTVPDTHDEVVAFSHPRPPREAHWRVRSRDGRVYYFGSSPESRISPQDEHTFEATIAWDVDRIEDRFGNYMDVRYVHTYRSLDQDPTVLEHRPREIRYTGHVGTDEPLRRVTFEYESRPDAQELYSRGLRVWQPVRIARIVIESPDGSTRRAAGDAVPTIRPVREYQFAYGSPESLSLLSHVKECAIEAYDSTADTDESPDRTCKPPVQFRWTQGRSERPMEIPTQKGQSINVPPVDFGWPHPNRWMTNPRFGDMDGVPGQEMIFARAPSDPCPSGICTEDALRGVQIFMAAFSGGAAVSVTPLGATMADLGMTTVGLPDTPYLEDLDADGRADVIGFQPAAGGKRVVFRRFVDGSLSSPVDAGVFLADTAVSINWQDANGDGYADLLYCDAAPDGAFRWHIGYYDPAAPSLPSFSEPDLTPFPCQRVPLPSVITSGGGRLVPASALTRADSWASVSAVPRPDGRRAWWPLLIDMNGDQVPDWVHLYDDPSGPRPSVYVRGADGAYSPMSEAPLPFDPNSVSRIHLIDVNDDGLLDAIALRDLTPRSFSASVGGGVSCVATLMEGLPTIYQNSGRELLPGRSAGFTGLTVYEEGFDWSFAQDVNGDGRVDLIVPVGLPSEPPVIPGDPTFRRWVVALSDGHVFQLGSSTLFPRHLGLVPLHPAGLPATVGNYFRVDVNGDSSPETIWFDYLGESAFAFQQDVAVGCYAYGHISFRLFARDKTYAEHLLEYVGEGTLHAGLGHDWALQITYGPLNDVESYTPVIHEATCTSVVPCSKVARSLVTSSVILTAREIAGSVSAVQPQPATLTRYRYLAGRTHRIGQGWLGFEQTEQWSPYAGLLVRKGFATDRFPIRDRFAHRGRPIWIQTSYYTQGTDAGPLPIGLEARTNTDFTPAIRDLTQTFFSYNSQIREEVLLDGTISSSLEVRQEVDDYGNTTLLRSSSDAEHVDIARVEYESYPDYFQHSLPRLHTVESCVGDRCGRHARRFTYAESSGGQGMELRSRADLPDGDNTRSLIARYDRDDYGNVIQRDVSDGGSEHRTWSYAFGDFESIFPTEIVDPVANRRLFAFHPVHGEMWGEEDPHGVLTLHAYDGFGRLTLERLQGEGSVSYERRADAVHPSLRVEARGGSEIRYRFDALGRMIEARERRRLDGHWVLRDWQYDDTFGTLSAETLPHAEGEAASSITLSYRADGITPVGAVFPSRALGRVRTTTYPGGATTRFEYNGLETSTTDPEGNKRTIVRTPQGEPREVLDPEVDGHRPRTTYAYGPFGLLTGVVDDAGNTTSLEWDSAGRVTRWVDPDRGERQFAYDSFGEVLTERHVASDLTTVRTYDALGRLLSQRDEGAGLTTPQETRSLYDGYRLASASSTDGIETAITYDAVGQIESLTLSGTGVPTLQTAVMQRDSAGRVTRLRLPDGPSGKPVEFWYEFDNYGYVERAGIAGGCTGRIGSTSFSCDFDTEVWRETAVDGGGRLTSEQYGNSIIQERTYDPGTTRLAEQRILRSADVLEHQRLEYSLAGDILVRTSLAEDGRERSEHFSYDALHDFVLLRVAIVLCPTAERPSSTR
jgi:YD repeat-containing protein